MSEEDNPDEGKQVSSAIISEPSYPTIGTDFSEYRPFEKGIIGVWSDFLHNRFGTGPMLGKSVGAFIVSTVLTNVFIEDRLGKVSPNVFVMDIARTGLGSKTPVFKVLRKLMRDMHEIVQGPSKLTPESIHNFIKGENMGAYEKQLRIKARTKEPQKPLVKRDKFVIMEDEISRMLGDRLHKSYMSGTEEMLSKLWDGELGSGYTNARGFEESEEVYVSLYGAGSYRFLQMLDDSFFIQGLGYRVMWIDEVVETPYYDSTFFFRQAQDTELDTLIFQTCAALRHIKAEIKESQVFVYAPDEWLKWRNSLTDRFKLVIDPLGGAREEYESKMAMNALKLAMCYSASQFNIRFGELTISPETMHMAVEDAQKYVNMWEGLMMKAKSFKERESRPSEVRLKTRKLDLTRIIEVGAERGLFTKPQVKLDLNTTDSRELVEVMKLGIDKGWLEEMTSTSEDNVVTQGKLDANQYARFKPKRGPYPQVFRITEAGRKVLAS